MKDPQSISVNGNFLTAKRQVLKVVLKKCTGDPYCKTEEEIDDFLFITTAALYTVPMVGPNQHQILIWVIANNVTLSWAAKLNIT